MRAKSLNNDNVTEFLEEHAMSTITKPKDHKAGSSFMMFKDHVHWIEFKTYGGYCKGFVFGKMNIRRPQSGFDPLFTVSF
ncbi:MAG: hypothetical protein P8J32_07195 [bacterium]|nr:hypothetical protein [bacterium]